MDWYWGWGLIVICILASALGGNKSSTQPNKSTTTTTTANTTTKKAPETTPDKPATSTPAPAPKAPEAIKISADKLYTAYKDNEVAADEKYKNKTLEVSGTVDDIKKDIADTPYIALSTDDLIGRVQCMFDKSTLTQLSELKKGQQIKITGKCTGLMFNVILKDSKIVE